MRQGLSAKWVPHRTLHQGSSFEDHFNLLSSGRGLVRQLRPRSGRRRVRRMYGHQQAHPDEEILRDGLRLLGEKVFLNIEISIHNHQNSLDFER